MFHEERSIRLGYWCFYNLMVKYDSLYFPLFFVFVFAPQNPGESFHRQNANLCKLFAPCSQPKYLVRSQSTSTISNFEPQINRLDHLRQLWQSEGRSNDASNLISNSWRQATEKQYESARIYWVSWCSIRIDPFTPAILGIGNVSPWKFTREVLFSLKFSFKRSVKMSSLSLTLPLTGVYSVVHTLLSFGYFIIQGILILLHQNHNILKRGHFLHCSGHITKCQNY